MHLTEEQIKRRALDIIRTKKIANVLVTRGKDGMTLQTPDRAYDYPARTQEVTDVCGAGDTVTAVLALGLACGIELPRSVELANIAAGIVVGKCGAATVSLEELRECL